MTDLEKALQWLPDVWQQGQRCPNAPYREYIGKSREWICTCGTTGKAGNGEHDIPCPQPTPELGFHLLGAFVSKLITVCLHEGSYEDNGPAVCRLKPPFVEDWTVGQAPDLLTAIIKAAAVLADKE